MNMKWCSSLLLALCFTPFLLAQNESLLIGPGDQLHIQVLNTPELDETARVTDAGDLRLILGGDIMLRLLTPGQAAQKIEQRLRQELIMYNPRVLVTVVSYSTQNVTVFGQVIRPGSYPVDTPRSVLDVLAQAGGFTELGDHHIIVERHGSGERTIFYIPNTPEELTHVNLIVGPGDKVIVPKTGIVYVLGDVNRAGGYPMNDNESGLTVVSAVALAGGTAHSAVPSAAKLIRRDAAGAHGTPLPLSAMQKGKKPDEPLQDGDIIYVPFSYLRNAALGLTGIAASAASAVIYTK